MNMRPDNLPRLAPLPANADRRRLTADDLQKMLRASVLTEDDRIELIDGEMVQMSPQGVRHEAVKNELLNAWSDLRPPYAKLAVESPLRLSPMLEPVPDLFVFPRGLRLSTVRGESVLLVVEVADTSLSYDIEVKAPRYGANGVRETWVIDAHSLTTSVFRDPSPEGYNSRNDVPAGERLTPLLVPERALRLADIDPG
jgi:Uma2 family endonuclease